MASGAPAAASAGGAAAPVPSQQAFSLDVASLTQKLHEHWNTSTFRDRQLDAIAADLSGRDCFVSLPTGAGKSLCFQLPAIAAPKPFSVTIVIVPLLALAIDQGEETSDPQQQLSSTLLFYA